MSLDELIGWETHLTAEELDVRLRVGHFVRDSFLPRITEDFEEGRFPSELIPDLAGLGLLGMNIQGPGCAGLGQVAYGLACNELEYGDSGLRSFVSVHTSLAMYAIERFGSADQKSEWLPQMAKGEKIGCFGLTEPDHGSNPAGMTTHARKDGDDWIIEGTKRWVTNGNLADVMVVWVKTGDDAASIRGFIVDMKSPGLDVEKIPYKISMRASDSSQVRFNSVRVPASNILPIAEGLKGPLSCLNNARFGVAFGVLGAARFCLEAAINHSCTRVQFDETLAHKQLIQDQLADMANLLVQGSISALHYGRMKEAGTMRGAHTSIIKRNNCQVALNIARRCRGILGANGILGDRGVLRHAVNLESTYTYEGTHEMHTLVLGEALTGVRAF
jgi:glutaryl-CoA dehydrogenase